MTRKLRELISRARTLESTIADTVDRTARNVAGSPATQPLEIAHAIVDDVEREIQPAGRGQHAFPFNHVRVVLLAVSPRAKAHLEVVCEGPPSLQERIVERLGAAGCVVPNLSVKVSFVTKGRSDWDRPEFHVEYERNASPLAHAPQPQGGPRLELTVLKGTTGQASHIFETSIALGRGAEVRDSRHRLIRTNQVAFTEGGGEINHSVSRRHARIEYEPASAAYRVYDDGSAQGTTVIRKGRGLPVQRGTKGMTLQTGDELVLGEAQLGVKISRP